MNETIRRGDYLEVEPTEKEQSSEVIKKKTTEETNPNIYTEAVSVGEILQRLRLPMRLPNRDTYTISTIRDQLVNIKKQTLENPSKNASLIQEIESMLVELANMETVDKVSVEVKPFPSSTPSTGKFPPPKDYKLMLPYDLGLDKRVKKLQELEYPSLVLSELLISILLGERQSTVESVRGSDKASESPAIPKNEELIVLSQRFEKLEPTISDFASLTDRINESQSVHNSGMGFIQQLQVVSNRHHEIQQQLSDNMALATKLQENWTQNKSAFSATLAILKERFGKIRK